MNETDYCNMVSNAINEHFREENEGRDSDVFVDEVIEDGVIALNWHVYLDHFIMFDYVSRVASFVFDTFDEVKMIMSPCEDFKRQQQ